MTETQPVEIDETIDAEFQEFMDCGDVLLEFIVTHAHNKQMALDGVEALVSDMREAIEDFYGDSTKKPN